jgi:hypothetical protein
LNPTVALVDPVPIETSDPLNVAPVEDAPVAAVVVTTGGAEGQAAVVNDMFDPYAVPAGLVAYAR